MATNPITTATPPIDIPIAVGSTEPPSGNDTDELPPVLKSNGTTCEHYGPLGVN